MEIITIETPQLGDRTYPVHNDYVRDASIGTGPADLAPGAATSSYDSVGWQEVLRSFRDVEKAGLKLA